MKRFICILFTMILLGSLLIIPISAADQEYVIPAGEYVGNDTITFDSDVYFYFEFYSNGEYFYGMLYEDHSRLAYLYDADVEAPTEEVYGPTVWNDRFRTIIIYSDTAVSADFYAFMRSNFSGFPPDPVPEPDPSDSVLAVFTALTSWLTQSFSSIVPMFFSDGRLTVLGFIFIVPLAFSVVFLFINFLIASLLFRR